MRRPVKATRPGRDGDQIELSRGDPGRVQDVRELTGEPFAVRARRVAGCDRQHGAAAAHREAAGRGRGVERENQHGVRS